MKTIDPHLKNIQQSSNETLQRNLLELTKQERTTTLEILLHLIEVDKRKLFAEAGYNSLFSYVVFKLGYSEPAANHRIRTARCIAKFPQVYDLLVENRLIRAEPHSEEIPAREARPC